MERVNHLLNTMANASDADAKSIRAELERILPTLGIRENSEEFLRRMRPKLVAAEELRRAAAEKQHVEALRVQQDAIRKAKEDIEAERKRLVELEVELDIKPQR
jgi:hypothetical protein